MLIGSDVWLILVLALLLDAAIGDPDWIWRRVPHPVVWIGTLIRVCDHQLNRDTDSFFRRRLLGALMLAVILVVFTGPAWLVHRAVADLNLGFLIEAVLASLLIAQRSLHNHVASVAEALDERGLPEARKAIAMVVGRDPDQLDAAGISRAAIETTAENFSDAVVAPAFWLALFGLPGLVAYKVVNTADSMIGHLNPRYRAFGWASARLDDVMNLVPARLSGVLIGLAAPLVGGALHPSLVVMRRDAGLHRSPNAGWPEAAMAGALGLALGGPRRYGDLAVDAPYLNAGGRFDADSGDIRRGLQVFIGACGLHILLALALALVLN